MTKFKLRHRGCGIDYRIQTISKDDHPKINVGKPGSNYVRKWKNHVSFYFADKYNDGTIDKQYKSNIKQYVKYLTELGLTFDINEKLHKGDKYNYTLIKLGLDQVKIVK
jgi:hypothetical protein